MNERSKFTRPLPMLAVCTCLWFAFENVRLRSVIRGLESEAVEIPKGFRHLTELYADIAQLRFDGDVDGFYYRHKDDLITSRLYVRSDMFSGRKPAIPSADDHSLLAYYPCKGKEFIRRKPGPGKAGLMLFSDGSVQIGSIPNENLFEALWSLEKFGTSTEIMGNDY